MTKVRKLDFYPDEYIASVAGVLDAPEQAVFWMVSALIMSEGGAIPRNERRIGMLTGMRPSAAKKIIEKLINMGKLRTTSEGNLAQDSAISSVETAQKRMKSRRKVVEKSSASTEKSQQNKQRGGKSRGDGAVESTPPGESKSASRKRRASRIADNWEPSPEDREFADSLGVDPDWEAEKFRDYWAAKSGQAATKIDWSGTWRNWVRNQSERNATAPAKKKKYRSAEDEAIADLYAQIGYFE